MKCYNCDAVMPQIQRLCPVCHVSMEREDYYNLQKTKKILDNIKDIKDFAHFIGLFYVKSIILLIVAVVAILSAVYAFVVHGNRILYMVLAVVFVFAFNFFLEMKKVESFYADFKKGNNRYVIAYPFKNEFRTFIADCMESIPNDRILRQRLNAYNKRDKEIRTLRFKTFGLFHPQKPKLFTPKKEDFFKKHMNPEAKHFIKTGNYDDESYIAFEGTIHGFLVMDSGLVTLLNIPKVTKDFTADKRNLLKMD
ncbi:hypothetical protein [Mycoplasma sp. P36-A1]|uniref:hypothetical protein n=1 Tax=Mycoplasma sp. P36-A1 TaxID=3252900 RepID=UPI003C30159E